VFFVGILPALFTFWIRRHVEEPDMWKAARAAAGSGSGTTPAPSTGSGRVVAPGLIRLGIILAAMNAATMFAWWGLNLWVPSYLSLPVERGGLGLAATTMSTFIIVMQVGMWFGYVTFGFVSDAFGRRPTYVAYLLTASALVWIYGSARDPVVLMWLGPLVAFFGTGYFSGFGAIAAEVFPTSFRATAMGLTYNVGRLLSAAAPFIVGALAQTRGFGAAFTVTSIAFLVAAVCWVGIPETKGRALR
jgi:MFS family permease